jgi:RecJ-like exonuclease
MLAAAILLGGCNGHMDKISDIQDNSSQYAGKEVHIGGEVTHVLEVPGGIINTAAYEVNDGTGQIWVISQIGAPREGDKVEVKGTVKDNALGGTLINGTSLGTVIKEEHRDVK